MAKKFDLKLKGYVGGWDFDTDYVDYFLDKSGDKEVSVLIDSLGGSVATALSVSTAFAHHGNVHVHYRGMNASAATIASMGAKHISIDSSAMYLVHRCSFPIFEWAALNVEQLIAKAEEYKKMAADAEKVDLTIATLYAKRCKKDIKDLLTLMTEDKWLTAQEALEWGFVDEVEDSDEDIHLTQSVANAMAAAGIPIPENMQVEADGFLAVMERFFTKWFGKKQEEPGAVAVAAPSGDDNQDAPAQGKETSEEPDNINQQNSEAMKKVYALVAAILAVTASEFEANAEGKFTLDEPQMDALEAALKAAQDKEAALTAEKQALQEKLNSANATIDELKKKPAEDKTQVVDTGAHPAGGDNPLETMQANIAEARRMLGKE